MQTKKLVMQAFFMALIAVSAFIKIPLFSVPITMQSVFVTLSGVVLGAKYGSFAVMLYVVLGLLGLPVFTGGGGFSYILHPTFGFLIGFIIGAGFIGKVCEKRQNLTAVKLAFFSYISFIPMYITGTLYYYFLMKLYLKNDINFLNAVYYCFVLFIPGDILKALLCGFLGERLIKIRK